MLYASLLMTPEGLRAGSLTCLAYQFIAVSIYVYVESKTTGSCIVTSQYCLLSIDKHFYNAVAIIEMDACGV